MSTYFPTSLARTAVKLIGASLLSGATFCAVAQSTVTDAGALEGERIGPVDRYYGIPFAAPPVGDLRWRAPQPVPAWEGVRSAKVPGKACTQYGHFFTSNDPETFGKVDGSEDCLYLNLWTPVQRDQPRPVFVFIHGGSGIHGDSAFPHYDGARLSAEADMVVITVNYRLGVFGGLQLPALQHGDAAEDSGNFFLLDLIRALDWVQANVRAFGGDPDNVTIAGHSAGAANVLALLRSPLATGKFHRAISYSGLPFSSSAETAATRSRTLLESLMLQDGSIDEPAAFAARVEALGDDGLRDYLYAKSAEDLLRASGNGLPPAMLADGVTLITQDKPDDLAMSIHNAVPIMIGMTRDELTTLTPFKRIGLTASQRWPLVNGEPRTDTLFDQIGWWGSLRFRVSTSIGDRLVRRELRKFSTALAKQAPAVYAYFFTWDDFPEPWRDEMGAFHGLDLAFVFGNFIDDRPAYMRFAWTEETRTSREALHRRMTTALRNFVASGDPNPLLMEQHAEWPQWGQRKQWLVWDIER